MIPFLVACFVKVDLIGWEFNTEFEHDVAKWLFLALFWMLIC